MNAPNIDGLILCGGKAERMGNLDKGLVKLHNQPLVRWVANRLINQVGNIYINANRSLDDYRALGFQVVADITPDFAGPLAGFQAGLKACTSDYLLICPCDSPLIPSDLASRLFSALESTHSDLAYVATRSPNGLQTHPVFCLLKKSLLPNLSEFLRGGGRKIDRWFANITATEVIFDDEFAFSNINTLDDLTHIATLVS